MSGERIEVAVLGGDGRQQVAAERLERAGCTVATWGLNEGDTERPSMRSVRAILLPLPPSVDGETVAAPLCPNAEPWRFSELAAELPRGALIFGGRIPAAWRSFARQNGLACFDYTEDEGFCVRNALPTVEGALLLALETLPHTLFGSTVLVTGYGRIASLLADRLHALGAQTAVLARRERDLAAASIRGHRAIPLEAGRPITLPPDCRAVFNTVPSPILEATRQGALSRGCVYLELASPPGGMTRTLAEQLGLRYIHGGGLPGRCFPESAGETVAETVLSRLQAEDRKGDLSC